MYFQTIADALYMDGHGAFVWAAYAITIVSITLLLVLPRLREQRFLRNLTADLRRQRPVDSRQTPQEHL